MIKICVGIACVWHYSMERESLLTYHQNRLYLHHMHESIAVIFRTVFHMVVFITLCQLRIFTCLGIYAVSYILYYYII